MMVPFAVCYCWLGRNPSREHKMLTKRVVLFCETTMDYGPRDYVNGRGGDLIVLLGERS
jgi:hypothetical protein